ncbi:imidazole glycerol phosphate synthase subunit hisF [Mycobacterium xenopi 4042]|uniref:Imidazole glycerol phosphate synthase subunit hisF n=1 Tax=Mycobacterium xenopi 4042 TaxID=1299334 RepID=X7YQT9_MYCXE|nr:imidazole glycerol phosphate synthase subunit hisF [Mycobacterium xenopi 4042]
MRTVADVDALLRAGADKVSVNTAAIARPELLGEMARAFGSQCIVLSVDARTVPPGSPPTPSGWEVTTHGGRRAPASMPSNGQPAAPSSGWAKYC